MSGWEMTYGGIPAQCVGPLVRPEEWPTMFMAVPRKGDQVQARSGTRCYVCGVTWMCDGSIEVELDQLGVYR